MLKTFDGATESEVHQMVDAWMAQPGRIKIGPTVIASYRSLDDPSGEPTERWSATAEFRDKSSIWRPINALIFLWLALSRGCMPVDGSAAMGTRGEFLHAKVAQFFEFKDPANDPASNIGSTLPFLLVWFLIDRWLRRHRSRPPSKHKGFE